MTQCSSSHSDMDANCANLVGQFPFVLVVFSCATTDERNSFVYLFSSEVISCVNKPVSELVDQWAVSNPGKPGHCPGKVLICCGYSLWKLGFDIAAPLHVLPALVTWQL